MRACTGLTSVRLSCFPPPDIGIDAKPRRASLTRWIVWEQGVSRNLSALRTIGRLESAGPGPDMAETRTSKGSPGDSPAAPEHFGRIGQPIRRSGVRRAQTLKMSVFFFPSISERVPMNKLIAVLVAGLFATSVFAQNAAPATPAAKAEAKAEKDG